MYKIRSLTEAKRAFDMVIEYKKVCIYGSQRREVDTYQEAEEFFNEMNNKEYFGKLIEYENNIETCNRYVNKIKSLILGKTQMYSAGGKLCDINFEHSRQMINESENKIKKYKNDIKTILDNNPQVEAQWILYKITK